MSKAKPVYDAISDIKDEYINDAMQQSAPKKNGNFRYVLEAVACVVIVCGFVALSFVLRSVSGPVNTGVGTGETTEQETTEQETTEQETTEQETTEQKTTEQTTEADPAVVSTDTEYATENDSTADVTYGLTVTEQITEQIFETEEIEFFDVDFEQIRVTQPYCELLPLSIPISDMTLQVSHSPADSDSTLLYEVIYCHNGIESDISNRSSLTIRIKKYDNSENHYHSADYNKPETYDRRENNAFAEYALFTPRQLQKGLIAYRVTDNDFTAYISYEDYIVEYRYDNRGDSDFPTDEQLFQLIAGAPYGYWYVIHPEDTQQQTGNEKKVPELQDYLYIINTGSSFSNITDRVKKITENTGVRDLEFHRIYDQTNYLEYDYLVNYGNKEYSECLRFSEKYKAVFYYKEEPGKETVYSLVYKEDEGGAVPDITPYTVRKNAVFKKEFEKNTGMEVEFDSDSIKEYIDKIYDHPGTTQTKYRIMQYIPEEDVKDHDTLYNVEENGVSGYLVYFDNDNGMFDYHINRKDHIKYTYSDFLLRFHSYFVKEGNSRPMVTKITIRNDKIKLCGIDINSSFDDFEKTFSALGFKTKRTKNAATGKDVAVYAEIQGLKITFRGIEAFENDEETAPWMSLELGFSGNAYIVY